MSIRLISLWVFVPSTPPASSCCSSFLVGGGGVPVFSYGTSLLVHGKQRGQERVPEPGTPLSPFRELGTVKSSQGEFHVSIFHDGLLFEDASYFWKLVADPFTVRVPYVGRLAHSFLDGRLCGDIFTFFV